MDNFKQGLNTERNMENNTEPACDDGLVEISAERLRALEALEARLPSMIEAAILEYKKNNLKRLHEKDKLDPTSANLRVKRYAEKHRDEINAKRREKRRLKKLEASATSSEKQSAANVLKTGSIDLQDNSSPFHTNTVVLQSGSGRNIVGRLGDGPSHLPYNIPRVDVTVRFDD